MQLKRLSVFVLVFFVNQVWNDDMVAYETTFIGLPQEKGLGYSGYVNLPAESQQPPLEPSECLGFTINTTSCSFIEEIPENGLMVMQAWVAATVRNNMLAFLGFLLHQPNRIFNANAYRGVDIIYQQFRINNVKIMDILQKLPAIYEVKRERQHIEFLKALKYHATIPKFFRGAIDGLLTILAKKKTRFYYSATDKRKLNFFSNIPRKFLPYLRPTTIYRKYDRAIRVDLGKEFAIFFSAIKEHKLRLTQPILAVLMLHMRFDLLSPEENENFLYLVDILRYNRIPNWTPGFQGTAISASPYDFVHVTLAAIASLPQVESSVKDIASRLRIALKRSSRSNRTRIMEHFFNKEDLSISLLLKALHKLISIPEVDMFHGLVNQKKLNLNYALKGFNRYFYDSPHQLVLAFVKRVLNRVPMNITNREIVKKVYEALQKFKLVCADHDKQDMESELEKDLQQPEEEEIEMDEMQEEQEEEQEEEEEEEEEEEQEEEEDKEHVLIQTSSIDTDKYLNNSQKYKRNTRDLDDDDTSIQITSSVSHTSCNDKHCISGIATEVFRPTEWKNSPVMDLNCPKEPAAPSVSSWLSSLDYRAKGVGPSSLVANASIILSIFMNKSDIISLISRLDGPSSERHSRGKSKSVKLVELKSRKNLLKSIFKKILSIPKVQENRIVYYEVVRIYYILIHGLGSEDEREKMFSNLKLNDRSGTINEILSGFVSKSLDKLIRDFHRLNDSQLAEYPTNRMLLIHLCGRFLMLNHVKNNSDLFNEIITLLRVILQFPIEFPMLKQSLDKLRYQDLHNFKYIYESLRKSDLVSILGDDFDLARYPTKVRLFKKIVKKLSKVKKLQSNPNFERIFKINILHTICINFEAEPVDEMLVEIKQQLNINKIMEQAYESDKTQITGVIAEAFTKIFNFHNQNVNSLLRMSSDNVSLNGIGTEFLRKFLDSIDEIVERDYLDVKKNIALMKSVIFTATPAD